jgi:hypothetical protein
LIVQETGWRFLQGLGVTLVAADSPDSFLDTTLTAVLIRQVLGAVSQFEKTALVAKLKSARDRKKRETGKCGGRKSYAERNAAMVMLAKKLARYPVKGRKRSLRDIAVELKAQGYVNERGAVFTPKSISSMLGEVVVKRQFAVLYRANKERLSVPGTEKESAPGRSDGWMGFAHIVFQKLCAG